MLLFALAALPLAAGACGDGTADPTTSPPTTETVATSSATSGNVGDATLSERDLAWIEDIEFLAAELPKKHIDPFHSISAAAFGDAAETLTDRVAGLSDAEIGFEVMRLAALIGDAHTRAQVDLSLSAYPIAVELFDDGLVVIASSPAQKDLLGASLVGVHGVPIDAVISAGLPYFSADRPAGSAPEVARLLVSPEFLDVVLGDEANHRGALTFEADGQEFTIDALAPIPLDEWRGVLTEQPDRSLSVAETHPEAFYWFQPLPEADTFFVQYNVCADAPDLSFADFTANAFEQMREQPPARLVIDLRLNGGGNSEVFRPFLERLVSEPPVEDGNLFVLIGSRTFSSAIMAAVDLRDEAGAILVGQPTSATVNSYGEARTFELPNSGTVVGYSTKLFELDATSDDEALVPDRQIPRLSTDFFAGIDGTLMAVLSD